MSLLLWILMWGGIPLPNKKYLPNCYVFQNFHLSWASETLSELSDFEAPHLWICPPILQRPDGFQLGLGGWRPFVIGRNMAVKEKIWRRYSSRPKSTFVMMMPHLASPYKFAICH